jgi:hypothetical protein
VEIFVLYVYAFSRSLLNLLSPCNPTDQVCAGQGSADSDASDGECSVVTGQLILVLMDPSVVDHLHQNITESITREAIQYLMTEGLYDDGKVTDNIQRVQFVSSNEDDEKDSSNDSLLKEEVSSDDEEETFTTESVTAYDMSYSSKILLGFGAGLISVFLGGLVYKCRHMYKQERGTDDKDGDYDHNVVDDDAEEGEFVAARHSSTNLVIHNKITGNLVALDKNLGHIKDDDSTPFDETSVVSREAYDEEISSISTISTFRDAEILSIDIATCNDVDRSIYEGETFYPQREENGGV